MRRYTTEPRPLAALVPADRVHRGRAGVFTVTTVAVAGPGQRVVRCSGGLTLSGDDDQDVLVVVAERECTTDPDLNDPEHARDLREDR